jgi:uncharacterized protein
MPDLLAPDTRNLRPEVYKPDISKMQGETDLQKLIVSMRPVLNEGAYVFCCVGGQEPDLKEAVFYFKEKEGITVVYPKIYAESKGYAFSSVFAWITLQVHSALEAVGLTAAFSTALARVGISCNVVAGFYHDHIFVQEARAEAALKTLEDLSGQQR